MKRFDESSLLLSSESAALLFIIAAGELVLLLVIIIFWMGKRCAHRHSSVRDPSLKSKTSREKIEAEVPFDKLADSYDSSFCNTAVGRLLRRQTWKNLDEAFATSKLKSKSKEKEEAPILDISCGTGDDAIHLASQHVHVVATDYSPGMLRKARQKCCSNPCVPHDYQPTFKELDLRDSHYNISLDPIHKFSGAYCNFGGLNNLSPEEISHLAYELLELVHPGGKVVLVVMGRFCLVETLYYLWKCNLKRAFRRLRSTQKSGGVSARVAPNTKKQTIYFYSLSFLDRTFHNTRGFRTVKKRAIGLTLPPSLWSRSSSKRIHPCLLLLLSWLDSVLSDRWPFLHFGDHFLIEFERL
jgi:SAM-dependent methyltransferase